MTPQLKSIDRQVMVITGASSGIGLATARLAAERGATVVLAARSRDALEKAVEEINQGRPAQASFVVADVGSHAEHERIAAHAIARHGRIDTWVNNAGVLVFGKLADLAENDMRRLFETNFWGVVHGSLIATRHLRAKGGALINVGSLESDLAVPLQGIYSASKHAVKAFTNALREEFAADGAPISVTLVKPAAIATPMPRHAKSYMGHDPRFPGPLYAPEEAARMIVAAAAQPVRDAYVGSAARVLGAVGAVAPHLTDWINAHGMIGAQIDTRPPTPGDNLDRGFAQGEVRGDVGARMVRPSLYSLAARHAGTAAAMVGGLAIGGLLLAGRARRSAGK